MRIVKLAAGFAVGYVLGTRAGRERFEQITETARRVTNYPTGRPAQQKATAVPSTGGAAVITEPPSVADGAPSNGPTRTGGPRPARRKPASTTVTPHEAGEQLG